jgi:predicted MPP superfamily phosphohydrolase
MTLLYLKVLILLWLINFAPPLLAHFLADQWNRPLDHGKLFRDGRPLFGPHKTERGVLGALLMGYVAGLFLGYHWWVGITCAFLSMAGDLLSSFIKRRLGQPSGTVTPGLDQLFEGLLPLTVLAGYHSLRTAEVVVLLAVFAAGAFLGSWFFKKVLLEKPGQDYPRPVSSRVRFKELRRCSTPLTPFQWWLNLEDVIYYNLIMTGAFRLLGLYEKGRENALQICKREITLTFPDLPEAFDGYTILFMSDLHLDGLDGLTEKLQELLAPLTADLFLLGGDLRMETYGSYSEALARFMRLLPSVRVRDGMYGVLGNHDCLEMVPELMEAGISVLINDAVALERQGQRLWIVGIDDPHHFQCHDLKKAFEDIPRDDFVVFLSHSPEVYREAQQAGARLYLCGHTHAGQIQILPIGPIFTHSRTGRRYVQGSWQYHGMQGYTSAGVGTSGIPVRYFSEGEVVVITLKRTEGNTPGNGYYTR